MLLSIFHDFMTLKCERPLSSELRVELAWLNIKHAISNAKLERLAIRWYHEAHTVAPIIDHWTLALYRSNYFWNNIDSLLFHIRYAYSVWEFQDFSVTQIMKKTTVFAILGALETILIPCFLYLLCLLHSVEILGFFCHSWHVLKPLFLQF